MEEITNKIIQETGIETAEGGKRLKSGGKRSLILAGAVLLTVVAAAYLTCCFQGTFTSTFAPRTDLEGIPVGGLTVEEAAAKLTEEWPKRTVSVYLCEDTSNMVSTETKISARDLEQQGLTPVSEVTLEELGLRLPEDPESCVRPVFDIDHGSGFFANGVNYLKSLLFGRSYPCVALDDDVLDVRRKAAELTADFSFEAVDCSYALSEDSLAITAPQDGRQVDAQALEKALTSARHKADPADRVAVASYQTLPAETLTAQEIHDTLAAETRNASYDPATGTITPEQIGGTFDVTAAQAALDAAAPGETITVPAEILLPEITAADLEATLFRDVLGECRTHVSGSAGRISNVKLSAAAFHGLVLNDGEILSYNETTGQRTTAKGYKPAPAYVGGETVDEIGGGVCQTSSTLYLACLRSNLKIVERYAHRYTPAYIPWGMDATVSWGGPDLKFCNDTGYPIKIVTSYADEYLTIRILGTNMDGITTKITAETLSQTDWKTVYEEDPTLSPGAEKVKVTPYGGAKVKSYRNVYDADGKLISSRLEASSDYKVRDKVIARGPLKVAPLPPVDGPILTPPVTPMPPIEELPPVEVPPIDGIGSLPTNEPIILVPEDPN